MSLLEQIIARLTVAATTGPSIWLWRKLFRPELKILTEIEKGPISRELGFTEAAVKIMVINKSSESVQIKGIHLMFCGNFGHPVFTEAPDGRSHHELPASLASGAEDHWYIPAEKLSHSLLSLYHPPEKSGSATYNLKLYPRCITNTGKVYKGQSFPFPTNLNSF